MTQIFLACPFCGAYVADADPFCPGCGKYAWEIDHEHRKVVQLKQPEHSPACACSVCAENPFKERPASERLEIYDPDIDHTSPPLLRVIK